MLVTDGEQRAALAVVRSLGQAGHVVHVCALRGRSLAGSSKYCRGQTSVPDPLTDSRGFVTGVNRIIAREGVDVLIPISEPALLALLPLREELELHGVVLPFADEQTFRAVCDKEAVLEAAHCVGIHVPAQVVLTSAADPATEGVSFPVALKPARSVGERDGRRIKLSVGYAATIDELRSALAELDPVAFPVLAQQRIIGPGIGVFLLTWGGEVLAAFAHRRIREKPPSGGVSVYRESIPLDPGLVEQSQQLLASFGWRGVAMVEYKVEATTGLPYLMEINGRFWGSLQLAIDAGVDFPRLLLSAAIGQQVPPVRAFRTGVRSRWWWGDVDQLLLRLRRHAGELDLPPGAPGRAKALGEFLRLWRPGDRNEVLRFSDPRPFVRETLDWLRGR